MKCEKCGEDTFLPFRCQFCGGYFCSGHRLPENHQCPRIEQARMPKEEMQPVNVGKQPSYEHTFVYPTSKTEKGKFGFSRKETMHLAVAALLVVGVGFTFPYMVYNDYIMLAFLSAMFAVSFLVHEIAHKIMAQRHGLWAEFRLTLIGAILTLLSILPTYLKIIAPGAVMVRGTADKQAIGKTSIIGPTANIILATIFYVIMFLPIHNWTFPIIAFYNAVIAIFNLIPFGVFDGYKVFIWDKRTWALTFTLSVALGVVTYRLLF